MTHGRRLSTMLAALVLALGGALLTSPSAGAALLLDGAATAAGTFTSLPPSRVLDTRTGTGAPKAKLAPHGTVTLRVTGTGGVPTTGVAAVVLNLTVTDPTAGGHITAHPAGTTPPTASNLNFTPARPSPTSPWSRSAPEAGSPCTTTQPAPPTSSPTSPATTGRTRPRPVP